MRAGRVQSRKELYEPFVIPTRPGGKPEVGGSRTVSTWSESSTCTHLESRAQQRAHTPAIA